MCARFKASETLLGIETRSKTITGVFFSGFKASETLLGIETKSLKENLKPIHDSKPLKPF